jgi:hypothetical protein
LESEFFDNSFYGSKREWHLRQVTNNLKEQ